MHHNNFWVKDNVYLRKKAIPESITPSSEKTTKYIWYIFTF